MIAPPYTVEFVQLFLPLIDNEDITGSLRSEDENDPVSEFIGRLNVCNLSSLTRYFFPSFCNNVEYFVIFSTLQVYSMVTEITTLGIRDQPNKNSKASATRPHFDPSGYEITNVSWDNG